MEQAGTVGIDMTSVETAVQRTMEGYIGLADWSGKARGDCRAKLLVVPQQSARVRNKEDGEG